MGLTHRLGLLTAFLLTSFFAHRGMAADYPERPIELIVPWGKGGGADQMARIVSRMLESRLGQGVAVVNIPGGTGGTGLAKLLAAPADGYSLAVYIADSHALLAGKNPRWSMNDITPVAVVMKAPSFIFVKQNGPFKTWADLVKHAKSRPGALKVATVGFGSLDSFSLAVLERSGIQFVQVPFAKPAERYASILNGAADALYEQIGDVAPLLARNEIRPILLFSEKRLPEFKDVPTSYEVGYKVALPQFRAIVVRAGTPPQIVKKLSDTLGKVYASPEYQKFIVSQHADLDSFESAETAPAFVRRQLEEMKSVVPVN